MRSLAKLIHKTDVSYLQTAFPAHYYGMPSGKIYLVYSRFYRAKMGKTGLEFIFAEHQEFYYDYKNEKIYPHTGRQAKTPVFSENIDKPNPNLNILLVKRDLNSYGEALVFLNKKVTRDRKPRIELLAS
jgi:hypothetical protein